MQGDVLTPAVTETPGLITGDDGARYTYAADQVRGETELCSGDRVDFINFKQEARDVFRVPEQFAAATSSAPAAGRTVFTLSSLEVVAVKADWPWQYYFAAVTKNYARFSGRARRAEFWSVNIIACAVIFACVFADAWLSSTVGIYARLFGRLAADGAEIPVYLALTFFAVIGQIVPMTAVSIRRLHDSGRSAWMYLITFAPYIGGIIALVLNLLDSQKFPNKYGPSPKYNAV
jgi:uncharacterized membrane protein YhaH (DUF805 family)